MPDAEDLLTVSQLAKEKGVDRDTIYSAIKRYQEHGQGEPVVTKKGEFYHNLKSFAVLGGLKILKADAAKWTPMRRRKRGAG